MTNIFSFKNFIIGLAVLLTLVFLGLYTNTLKLPITHKILLQHAADFSDDRILMGSSHNVFVAKVIKQTGNDPQTSAPSTQFAVEIIENIKGDLEGSVTVDQLGGYKDGVLYLVQGDTVGPEEDGNNKTELLTPGNTYLFATRFSPEKNNFVLIMHENALKLISNDENLSNEELKELATRDAKVNALKEAYKNEVLLEADIYHNNTLNSYKSTQGN